MTVTSFFAESVILPSIAEFWYKHPGVEIDSSIADSNRSVILQQVSHGIAVRMAVMAMCMQRYQNGDDE